MTKTPIIMFNEQVEEQKRNRIKELMDRRREREQMEGASLVPKSANLVPKSIK